MYMYDHVSSITGQDVFCLGTTGAMFGGMFCAAAILKRNLDNDLRDLCKQLKKRKIKTDIVADDVGPKHTQELTDNNNLVKTKLD